MKKPVVLMFSGQGSQHHQMARELWDKHAGFQAWMTRLDAVARRLLGASVVEELHGASRGQPFSRLLATHPAIFMVEYATARALEEAGVRPDFVLGASLGEFAAAAVAGVLEPEEALSLVIAHARALESHGAPGGMLAILGEPRLHDTEAELREHSELASVNFATHFVVSGTTPALQRIKAWLDGRSITSLELPVTRAFHSALMDPARPAFTEALRAVTPRAARVPLVSCLEARVVHGVAPDYFWEATRRPIRFRDAVRVLEARGPCVYVDAGPSGTLATFLKYGLPKQSASVAVPVLTPFGKDLDGLRAAATAAA
ncbi:acyltransferase domain-containing protein [Corallococcus sp. ZKHCc1 1396]|uniref:Acyltransferase domain-containing protein n=1 Tax=Corallococcus soli TaxID=2710757 RepID=A0ABR9PVB1_9BACT|nr:acyltransferase domain-containing protein [Corallococcus soli]MBE4751868.1 acyltransferase domain-containing protein [Corallococcus soli]